MKNTISKCKKLCSLIQTLVGRNITITSKYKYDDFQIEHESIINASLDTKCNDTIDDVWNLNNTQKVPGRKRGRFTNKFLSDDDGKDVICRKTSRKLKDHFREKQKHNASIKVFHETNTQKT